MDDFDYKSFQAKALEQLKAGKPLIIQFVTEGAVSPLQKSLHSYGSSSLLVVLKSIAIFQHKHHIIREINLMN